ncbi:LacI family DNA-binding transcriptional regulator [Actinomyces vulturis]|uniref:LacI family DNA-binding transcriptional regulator n=1 Tax=Actinomyces vulturis TaxID=1857645 RepID=UPI000833873B|nr:LacI family DNA-binding transcriptional regulator [Actinomyces vulturis]
MQRRTQLTDVAQACGVSVSTVSYILAGGNKAQRFSAKTQERVLAAAQDLGYVRDRSAQSLRRGRTRTVALFYNAPMDRFVERYILHAQRFFADHDYLLVSIAVDEGHDDVIAETLRSGLCDGALVSCSQNTRRELMNSLPTPPVPVMVVENCGAPIEDLSIDDSSSYDVIYTDEAGAVGEALDHLHANGCETIAYVGQHPGEADEAMGQQDERYPSYLSWCRQHHRQPWVLTCDAATIPQAYRVGICALAQTPRPQALYCASDRGAIGMMMAAQHLDLKIPQELSIVGTGASAEGAMMQPPLTTIGMSEESVNSMLAHFWSRLQGTNPHSSVINEGWRLFIRQTTPSEMSNDMT